MLAIVLLCAGVVGSYDSDRTAYQTARARAGKDAGAHLKLAVWCEAHGMDVERLEHLATAMAADPANAAVRGMMGLVNFSGKWLAPEKVGETVRSDEAMAAKLAEYEARREATPRFAQAQYELALWCEENGLKPEATAHFTLVTQIDPKRADAWRKLGCEQLHGKWVPADQAAAQQAEEDAQRAADLQWEKVLRYWKDEAVEPGPRHDQALAELNAINDPRAVPSIFRILAQGNHAQQELAAQILARIDCPASSHALAALALYNKWPEGRAFAIDILKRRDPRDYMDDLIGLLHRPFTTKVMAGGNGQAAGMIIDGEQMQMNRIYKPTLIPMPVIAGFGGPLADAMRGQVGPLNPLTAPVAAGEIRNGTPQRRRASRFTRSMAGGGPLAGGAPMAPIGPNVALRPGGVGVIGEIGAGVPRLPMQSLMNPEGTPLQGQADGATQQALARDLAIVEGMNAQIERGNQAAGAALRDITGESIGDDPDAWRTWWNDKLGLRYERTEPRYQTTTVRNVAVAIPFPVHHACFAAGTPVATLTGPRPIEELKLGDVVLSQDTATGVLSYQPIVGIHHNPPAQTVRLRFQDGEVVSTPVHRFWRPGRGWAMARDLKPGEFIRTVGGRAQVMEMTTDKVQPVFNLDVARNHSFFVGTQQLLVRDNSLPPAMETVFDAEPTLATIAVQPSMLGGKPSEGKLAPGKSTSTSATEAGSIWDPPAAPSSEPDSRPLSVRAYR